MTLKLFNVFKKLMILGSLGAIVFSLCMLDTKVYAINHAESSDHGFYLDADAYNIRWQSRRNNPVYRNGKLIGVTTTYVGVAVCNFLRTDGRYSVSIMTKTLVTPFDATYSKNVLWWTETWTEYGRAVRFNLSMDLDGYAELVDVSPKNLATSNTYNLGFNLGASAEKDGLKVELGISASQSFTANALTVTNKSQTYVNYAESDFKYENSIWRWDWARDAYADEETEQKTLYVVATGNRYRYFPMTLYSEFGATDAEPNWWQNTLDGTDTSRYYASIYIH